MENKQPSEREIYQTANDDIDKRIAKMEQVRDREEIEVVARIICDDMGAPWERYQYKATKAAKAIIERLNK